MKKQVAPMAKQSKTGISVVFHFNALNLNSYLFKQQTKLKMQKIEINY